MANKEALRDLQVRLANRLREAREQPRQVGWLAVECGGNGLLMPLAQAGEIHPVGRITAVPHAKPWLAGVANLRGELYAVVDLPLFLGLQEGAKSAGPAHGQLVALNASLNLNAALRVDRLVGLRDPEHMKVEHSDAPRPGFVSAGWRDAQGRLWQALDLAQMANDPAFLDVAYRPQASAIKQ